MPTFAQFQIIVSDYSILPPLFHLIPSIKRWLCHFISWHVAFASTHLLLPLPSLHFFVVAVVAIDDSVSGLGMYFSCQSARLAGTRS